MAKKSKSSDIRKLVEENKVVIGTEKTIKGLKLGNLSCVYITKNAPDNVKARIQEYAKLAGTDAIPLDVSNEELGVMCKKPFRISVLSVVKE